MGAGSAVERKMGPRLGRGMNGEMGPKALSGPKQAQATGDNLLFLSKKTWQKKLVWVEFLR